MGAGSSRVMLGVIDQHGISYEEIHRISNKILDIDGHDRWEMDRIVREIMTGISKAIETAKETPVSIGVDSSKTDLGDFEILLNNADAALYQAKNKGRNQVRLYGE